MSKEQKHLSGTLFSLELFFSLFFGVVIPSYLVGTSIISSVVFCLKLL